MRKFLQITIATLFLITGTIQISAEETCESACSKYKKCILYRFPNGDKKQLEKYDNGCKKSCVKHKEKVLSYFKGVPAKPNVNQCLTIHNNLVKEFRSK